MAYNFTLANTEYLQVTAAPVTAVPLTMACWYNTPSLTDNQTLMMIADTGSTQNWFRLFLGGAQANDPIAATTGDGTLSSSSINNYTSGAWTHAAAVFAAANSRTVYMAGSAGTTDTGSKTPTSLDTTAIGRRCDSAPAAYMNGEICEAAIWNVALTSAEIAQLAAGFSPLCLIHRLANLVLYQPLVNNLNDYGIGAAMTAFNTPTVSAHPKIFKPIGYNKGFFTTPEVSSSTNQGLMLVGVG